MVLPSLIVSRTLMSLIAIGSTLSGALSRITRSASLPTCSDVRSGLAGTLHRFELGKMGRSLLRRGDPCLRVKHLTRPCPVDCLLRGHWLGLLKHRKECRFHDEAIRLVRARLAHDYP